MVWGLNPGGDKILYTHSDRPWDPPKLLHNGYCVTFRAVKQLERGIDVIERIQWYLWKCRNFGSDY